MENTEVLDKVLDVIIIWGKVKLHELFLLVIHPMVGILNPWVFVLPYIWIDDHSPSISSWQLDVCLPTTRVFTGFWTDSHIIVHAIHSLFFCFRCQNIILDSLLRVPVLVANLPKKSIHNIPCRAESVETTHPRVISWIPDKLTLLQVFAALNSCSN